MKIDSDSHIFASDSLNTDGDSLSDDSDIQSNDVVINNLDGNNIGGILAFCRRKPPNLINFLSPQSGHQSLATGVSL